MLDFHNHIIPGVDDGSESLEQSLSALQQMWEHGITHVITTPHFRASTLKAPAELESQMRLIDDSWNRLVAAVAESLPQMKLDRGVELALDDPTPLVADARILLAGTRFLLVEFPWFTVPLNSTQPLAHLRSIGLTPIVAHPERYDNIGPDLEESREWKAAGAFLQLNAGSLVGIYGKRIERTAWQYLEAGLVDYLSSDFHARGTCLTSQAGELLAARNGADQLSALTEFNGGRLLKGFDPTPVAPLEWRPDSVWRRLKRAFLRD